MKKIFTSIITIILMFPAIAFAATPAETPSTEAITSQVGSSVESPAAAVTQEDNKIEPVSCDYTAPAKPVYQGQFIAVRKKGIMAKKEAFETKVYVMNTGNTPWFSLDSGCKGPVANLGTEKKRDRNSLFFTENLFWESNWLTANRIKMESPRVDPQGLATFTFWSQAPDADGLYREYFDVVIEGVTWIPGAMFSTDIKVGGLDMDPAKRELLAYIEESTNLATINLEGEKNIEVDISEQKMWLKIGDYVIRQFPVSTGTNSHPTPVGTTKILNKMQVRVAGSRPHYIMPKWMMYRKGGYGIHALPSLANDRGVYWREALAHIGTRRSHGCIRLLPKDAEFAYEFGEVGMTVVVHY